ncbi:MAG TPA: TetR/AcrR family transcriptional regulator [Virgibacillus sp.]|nr:TetR/AcrR family transcriptional regulator [Virgibacillus sp.]
MTPSQIQSSIKNFELVEKRRQQIIKASIRLFKEKGFHKTTTREIAKESGFSIGTLYEYVRTKEDVLFLVYGAIYNKVHERLEATIDYKHPSIENLIAVIESYIRLIDEMQEEVVIMYQEMKSLQETTKDYVLEKERELVGMLKQLIGSCHPTGITEQDAELIANNIFVQGQMWGFRRWALHKQFTLEEYTESQVHYLMRALSLRDVD